MIGRIGKCLLCIIAIPFLLVSLVFVGIVVLALPIYALMFPSSIKIGEE